MFVREVADELHSVKKGRGAGHLRSPLPRFAVDSPHILWHTRRLFSPRPARLAGTPRIIFETSCLHLLNLRSRPPKPAERRHRAPGATAPPAKETNTFTIGARERPMAMER